MTTITTSGSGERSAVLDLSTLRADFAGEILTPADGTRYDNARVVFNAMFDRRPALMARPSSPADVAAALRFARSAGLPIAVRGGGHSVSGYSTVDDGAVIDLSAMRQVAVDRRRGARECRRVPLGKRSTGRPKGSASPPRAVA